MISWRSVFAKGCTVDDLTPPQTIKLSLLSLIIARVVVGELVSRRIDRMHFFRGRNPKIVWRSDFLFRKTEALVKISPARVRGVYFLFGYSGSKWCSYRLANLYFHDKMR